MTAYRYNSIKQFGTTCLALTVLSLSGCGKQEGEGSVATTTAPVAAQQAELGDWGVQTQYLSSTVKPGDDFFAYVNEGWLNTADFPPGVPRIDSFIELSLKAEADIREIIADATANPQSHNQAMIAALYASYMDVDKLDALGIQPIETKLAAIFAADNHQALTGLMQQPGYTGLVDLGVNIDTRDPSRYILVLHQGGLGLPSREYYLMDAAPYPGHREAYVAYMADVFTLAGRDDLVSQAPAILELETTLAKAHWSNADTRDPVRMAHYMTLSALVDYAPGLDWLGMLNSMGAGLSSDTTIVANTDTALKETAVLFEQTSVAVLQAYMAFHLLDDAAEMMGREWQERHFAFHGARLQGLKAQRSRDENAITLLNGVLGEVVGQEYVARHFPPEYRQTLMTYIGYLREAFGERIESLGWMDDATRSEALKKLSMLNAEIGYPSRWHDYSALDLKADDLLGNIEQVQRWAMHDALAKLDEPVRDWEWGNNPQEINAYYSPAENKVVFLAAILQPPFFDPAADFAVNFGAILGVIGHETSHGFDDQGSQYDGTGRLRDWWTEASRKEFTQRADRLAGQYDRYEPLPGAHVNGRLTLGENIADLGGVSVAYHALQKYMHDHYPDGAPEIDGFTAEQRFFLAWAQMWRGKRTDDYARELLLRDPHSPSRYRANGTVRNMDAWYDAFEVGPKAALYLPKEERITTW